jgi:hypothetical protein
MPVSCPSGCSFVEAGRQTEPLDFAYQARVHPNPFSSNLRTSPEGEHVLCGLQNMIDADPALALLAKTRRRIRVL